MARAGRCDKRNIASAVIEKSLAKKLAENGLSEQDLVAAHARIKEQGVSLMYALEHTGKIDEQRLLSIMSEYYRTPKVDLSKMNLQSAVISLIPASLAEGFRIIPIDRLGNSIMIATGNPRNLSVTEKVRFATGYFAQLVLASESALSTALQKYYPSKKALASEKKSKVASKNVLLKDRIIIQTRGASYDSKVVELADSVLTKCFQLGASDIHVEPYADHTRIRLRIDGTLTEAARVESDQQSALIARYKVMSSMDISETRLPQDSSLTVAIDNVPLDFRVSTMPTIYGEKIVMRLLDQSGLKVDMGDLGFEKKELDIFHSAIHRPWGIVLVTGPTGSGKTTTLYSALSELNNVEVNILTAEDPVEYNIEGINQVEIKTKIDFNFAKILRSFLRQDPDVIMVGEIRDVETASIAVNAALTGHLVMSTLHTNNSYETITRLLNMGVRPHELVGALLCIVAQRLMRKLCQECKIVDENATPAYLVSLGIRKEYAHKIKVYKGKGCIFCKNMGFKGRVAIHEVLRMTSKLHDAIVQNASAAELKQVGISTGMRTLRQAALIKMANGIVSAAEVVKVTISDTD